MPTFKWEESVFKSTFYTIPCLSNHVVTAVTIGAKSCSAVIGLRGGFVLIAVTGITGCVEDVVALPGAGGVTLPAIGCVVCAYQRKAGLLVQVP